MNNTIVTKLYDSRQINALISVIRAKQSLDFISDPTIPFDCMMVMLDAQLCGIDISKLWPVKVSAKELKKQKKQELDLMLKEQQNYRKYGFGWDRPSLYYKEYNEAQQIYLAEFESTCPSLAGYVDGSYSIEQMDAIRLGLESGYLFPEDISSVFSAPHLRFIVTMRELGCTMALIADKELSYGQLYLMYLAFKVDEQLLRKVYLPELPFALCLEALRKEIDL